MRPTWKSTLTLLAVGVVLFVLSASGQPGGYWEGGPSWLGTISWFGFLICLLLLVGSGLYWAAAQMRPHDRPLPR